MWIVSQSLGVPGSAIYWIRETRSKNPNGFVLITSLRPYINHISSNLRNHRSGEERKRSGTVEKETWCSNEMGLTRGRVGGPW